MNKKLFVIWIMDMFATIGPTKNDCWKKRAGVVIKWKFQTDVNMCLCLYKYAHLTNCIVQWLFWEASESLS
jgi:hypothetical protein